MKEKIKSLFNTLVNNALVKPTLIGFVAITICITILSIPELAGAVGGVVIAWVFGKLIMTGYALYKEDF
jgi:uncharacterized membrane protein SpoIIM required for sporulation